MPTHTIIAPNHYRHDQTDVIAAWAKTALAKGFAAGPFRLHDVERVAGPIVTIPLTIVHTPAVPPKPAKDRVCFNATWDPNVQGDDLQAPAVKGSINYELRDEDIECEWFLLNEVKLLLASLPSHARVLGFDIVDAYQELGNAARQRRRLVFTVAGLVYVWLRGMFGVSTMAAIFGQLCDLTCAWLEYRWPTVQARHFADDHLVADVDPSHRLPFEEVLLEVERFGWTVHPTKRFSWARQFELLGFWWDLDTMQVRLTEHKRHKYVHKIEALLHPAPDPQSSPKFSYQQISSIVGSLVHTCAIFTERRCRLNALYAHRNRYRPAWRGQRLFLPTDVRTELRDWLQFLKAPELSASFALPSHTSPMAIYSDASNLGCGVVVDGHAQYWPLADRLGAAEVDIGVMEMWALHLALQAAVQLGARNCVATFHVDNLGVVYAARKGRSRSRLSNHCLIDIAERAAQSGIVMSIVYIASADNLADAPSRGDLMRFGPLNITLAEPWDEVLGRAASS